MLKGQAKKDYQRGYMRDYMRVKRQVVKTPKLDPVRPKTLGRELLEDAIRIHGNLELDADGNPIPEIT